MMKARADALEMDFGDDYDITGKLLQEDAVRVEVKTLEAIDLEKVAGVGDLPAKVGEETVEISYHVLPTTRLLADIQFFQGEPVIKNVSSFAFIRRLVDALKNDDRLKEEHFVIQGHASAEGDAVKNLGLSQARANTVFDALCNLGIDPERIYPVGFGEQNAKYPAHSSEVELATDRCVLIYQLVEAIKKPEGQE